MHIQEIVHIIGPRIYDFLGATRDGCALPSTRALVLAMRDAATEIAACKEVQELVQVIVEAQVPRSELRDRLCLPDLLVDMTKIDTNGMKC